jgi:hypothetical protein
MQRMLNAVILIIKLRVETKFTKFIKQFSSEYQGNKKIK